MATVPKVDKTSRSLEETLKSQLTDLHKSFTEECIQKSVQKTHSLGSIKTPEEYKRDREFAIQCLQQVSEPKRFPVQWKGMREEVEKCGTPEVTTENLPVHLYQFFCMRLAQLALLKYNSQVRWARFALRDAKLFQQLIPEYNEMIEEILQEYNICLNQARKLSIAMDLFKNDKPIPTNLIGEEEMSIYLRWLTYSTSMTRRLTTFLTEIQLMPLMNQEQPDVPKFKLPIFTRNSAVWSNLRTRIRRLSQTPSPNISLTSFANVSSETSPSSQPSNDSKKDDKKSNKLSGLPHIATVIASVHDNLEQLMMHYNIPGFINSNSSSDKLKIFYAVLGQFKILFQNQVDSMTFHSYNALPKDLEKKQGSYYYFRKIANWTEHIKLRANPDDLQLSKYLKMKDSIQGIDRMLIWCNECTIINNQERVLFALSQVHGSFVNPFLLKATSVPSYRTDKDPLLIWKCIYTAVDMRNPMNLEDNPTLFSLKDVVQKEDRLESKRGGLTNLSEAVKLLKEKEGRIISKVANSSLPRDYLFSYFMLRHLRIRDAKYKCLSIINYFCSIERTITLNSLGLSHDTTSDYSKYNRGIDSHLFETNADFVVNQSEFMQYQTLENRDDFYSFDNMSNIRVWDDQGKLIVYDLAEVRMKVLEERLLTIGTYFMEKDVLNNYKEEYSSDPTEEDLDINVFSQQSVDRYGLLFDLWNCQSEYMNEKMKLVGVYLEAYYSCYDKMEKEKVAQVIINIIGQEARIDDQSKYFIQSFQREKECIMAHYAAIQPILQQQLEDERTYVRHHSGYGVKYLGLPPPAPGKRLVSLSSHTSNNISHYFLESVNSLSSISLVSQTVNKALSFAVGLGAIKTLSGTVNAHVQLWKKVYQIWTSLRPLGANYNSDIQNRFFSTHFMDNPHNVVELMTFHLKQMTTKHETSPPLEKQTAKLKVFCDMIQLITSRHYLLVTCQQTSSLYDIYRKQSLQLEESDSHFYLRYVPFTLHGPSEKTLDDFVSACRRGKDETLDNFKLEYLPIAVQELDDQQIGRFSFHNKEDAVKILLSKTGLQNLMVTLQVQVATKNALLIACQQSGAIVRYTGPLVKERKFADFSSLASAASQHAEHIHLINHLQEIFISFKKEKGAVRDYMLSQFNTLTKGEEDLERRKCSLLTSYCYDLITSMSTYSLRHQLCIVYYKMQELLENYASTRDSYFMIGGLTLPSPSQTAEQAKLIRGHVKAVLSHDGKSLLNLFFIPHTSEILLTCYTSLSIEEQAAALTMHLQLVSMLLNILMYSSATAKLGRMCDSVGSVVTASKESIGSDIHQLQYRLSILPNPSDPKEVLSYLTQTYNCLIQSHDNVVRYCLKRTALTYNDTMIQVIDDVCLPSMNRLFVNTNKPHLLSHPLLCSTINHEANNISSLGQYWYSHGLSLVSSGPVLDVHSHVYMSMAPLDPIGRQAASGELLAMSLLLEDVLTTSTTHQSPAHNTTSTISYLSRQSTSTPQLTIGANIQINPTLLGHTPSIAPPMVPPLVAVATISEFIKVMTEVEQLRDSWGRSLLGVAKISSRQQILHLDKMFESCVVVPSRRVVAKQEVKYIKKQLEDEMTRESVAGGVSGSLAPSVTDSDISWEYLEQSECLNEHVLKKTQLSRLHELLHQQYLDDEIKWVNQLIQLSQQELKRETLPTDLWKRSSMKDIAGIPYPYIVEDFMRCLHKATCDLDKDYPYNEPLIEIPQSHFNKCIADLRSAILKREKELYLLYASFYESTVHSLYHQLQIKNQELEKCQHTLKYTVSQSGSEQLVANASYTHEILLEITALRVKVRQLKSQLISRESDLRDEIHQEYQSLVGELKASCVKIKDKYDNYRKDLHSDAMRNINKTRESVAASLAVLQDKLKLSSFQENAKVTEKVKGVENKLIQEENASLHRSLIKLRSLYRWKKGQMESRFGEKELTLTKALDKAQCQYMELKMTTEQEIESLKQQVHTLQKCLTNEETKSEILKKTLEQEKNKRASINKEAIASTAKDILPSKIERIQEEKINELTRELERQNVIVSKMSEEREKEKEDSKSDKIKLAKAVDSTKQKLLMERQLKLDAFHQVENLMNEVHDLEAQNYRTPKTPSLYSGSLFTVARQSTPSGGYFPGTTSCSTPVAANKDVMDDN